MARYMPDRPAPTVETLTNAFADLNCLHQLSELVRSCPPEAPPCSKLLFSERLAGAHSLAVLAGSFNPMTWAHLGLAQAADQEELGPVVFALSTRTIDKERPEGALLEDRLLVLKLHSRRAPNRAVALLNRGLYVDIAELIRSTVPHLQQLFFLVGFDKIVQIFDPRYYADRESALGRLFAVASFAVAARGRAGPAELTDLLSRPENRRFASAVRHIATDPRLADISSSSIRDSLGAGHTLPDLPPETEAFISSTGCYRPAAAGLDGKTLDPYGERRKLLHSVL